MEVILTQRCKSLTGVLGSGFGYHIQRRKNGFFAKRNSKGVVPEAGHWLFIVTCAELAKLGLHISDIKATWSEVRDALREAHHWNAADAVFRNADRQIKLTYNARDILNLKFFFGLW